MKFNLTQQMFSDKEFLIAENKDMKAYTFRYSSGVEAIRVENMKGSFTILPFQGQQIWRADFCGRNLVMKTTFDEPVKTTEYLRTYGGFLLHCGINAFGVPGEKDNHPQHGELPNVQYDSAYIDCGIDDNGTYMAVGGIYEYNAAFTKNYVFHPECRLYENDTVLNIRIEIENKRSYPMEYMYLCHINFNPVDGSELIYSAPYDSEHVKVFKIVGDGVDEERRKKVLGYMGKIEKNPAIHHNIGTPEEAYDPEICFAVDYLGDENGRAYTMQYTENGADFVSHPTDILPIGIRWISRTKNEDSMGMVLPATSEHLGYTHAKKLGQVKVIEPNGRISFLIQTGYLEPDRAKAMREKIEKITN